jgi:3-hydroxy-9,10-secoandrosta-1,3,5(10)-triene-9,17-dione monooxygenase reductase component
MPVNADQFRSALGHFASGVTVVTMSDGKRQVGLTVSAFSSVSLNPPYILVCIDKNSSTLDVLKSAQTFAVNLLCDNQIDLSNRFASKTDDKFSGVDHHAGQLGAPILENTLGFVECKVVQEIDAGDHFIYLGEVVDANVNIDKQPLLYYHGKYRSLAK